MAKMYSLTVRNRAGAIVFATIIVAFGVVFLTVGFALLAGLAIGAGLLGAGFSVYNRLRGRGPAIARNTRNQSGLDPALEVRPIEASVIRQLERGEMPE